MATELKITGIRLQRLRLPLEPPFRAAWDPEPRREFAATLVRVETDAGLVGVGSGDTMIGFEQFAHLFLGRDALALGRHASTLETISFHAGRYWPLEAALWDLAGQACGKPAATLLRRPRSRSPRTRRGANCDPPSNAQRTRATWCASDPGR